MGCDIHPYVEYRKKGTDYWQSFGRELDGDRHYGIFGRLAGVRAADEGPVIPVRGIPDNLGFWASDSWWLYVTEGSGDADGVCTREQAESYHKYGSRYRGDGKEFIEHPDWHTPSWCTPDEWESATCCLPGDWSGNETYKAILAAARSLETDGYEVRLVFWFDN